MPASRCSIAAGPTLYLKEQMARGKAYPTAIRALAFKWQRIMFVCWRDRVPYEETIYLQSLQRRGSHLAHKLNQQPSKAA